MARQVIPLNRLAEMLAGRTDISYDEARQFILQYFEAISYGLVSGSEVTIKGLGSFVRTSDAEAPVTFVPDEKLAKILNAPFEAFAPVPIQDGIEVPDDCNTIQDGTPNDTKQLESQPNEPDFGHVVEPVETNGIQYTAKKTAQSNEPEVASLDEDTTNTVASTKQFDVNASTEVPADTDDDNVLAMQTQDELTEETDDEDATDDNQGDDTEEQAEVYILPRRRCRILLWCALSLTMGVIGGIAIGYYFHDNIAKYVACDNQSECTPVPMKQAIKRDSVPVVNTDKADSAEIRTQKPVKPEEPVANKPEPRYDVVTSHQFLTTLAGKYYGVKDYWVYIYEANKAHLHHPDRIKPGTRILIPEISEYLSDPAPSEANIKQARNLAAQIYARYK